MQLDKDELTVWQRDESLREAGRRLARKSPGLRVVSFDFFDTLVSRLCAEPSDLFIEVGRRLAQRGMLLAPLSPPEFHSVRTAADERARRKALRAGQSSEVKLANIYQELKNVVRDPLAACQLEFDIERNLIYLNPATTSLARHARKLGYKTAILSDTYFTAAELQQLLQENGFSPSLFDAVIVSSERGKAKWNGQLYHDLFRHFDIHPSELLHIGDNVPADIHSAQRFGVETVHYYRTTPNLDLIFNGEKTQRGMNSHPAGSLNSLRVLTARQSESDTDAFRDGALTFGPLLARYADWCVERFAAAGIRTVLALMREGEILGALVQGAANAAGVELKVIPCFTSRLATALAAMPEITLDNAGELFESTPHVMPKAVLEILGLGTEAAQLLDASLLQKPLPVGEDLNKFIHLLFSLPRVRELIEKRRVEGHQLAFEYLNDLIGAESNIGVLDLGWSGSIQRNVARILRRGGRNIRTVGCYVACTHRSGRLALEGDSIHAFAEQGWTRSTILAEVAINACIGSTRGYARDAAGRAQPALEPYEATPEERRIKARLRDGIFAFQNHWLALRAVKGMEAFSPEVLADIDRNSAAILRRLLEFPTKPEADRLGALQHDENYFGQNHSAKLCNDTAAASMRRDGIQTLFYASRCHWPQGVVAIHYPRVVSALRSGWKDAVTLGRIGAWHGLPLADPGLTDEEVSSFGTLVNSLRFDQVIFAGSFAPILEEVFSRLWRQSSSHGPEAQARFIFIGKPLAATPSPSFQKHSAFIDRDDTDPATHRIIRSHLAGGNITLALTSDVSAETARALLNGLAPFLGPQGAVLAAGGRFDRFSVAQEAPLIQSVNDWHQQNGRELGYGLWTGPVSAQPHTCNWVVFRREVPVWDNQWMLQTGDLVAPLETNAELLVKA